MRQKLLQFNFNFIKTKIIILALFNIFLTDIPAQVTIGSDLAPEKAALLDIKTIERTTKEETTHSGGILMPCVSLVDKKTLEPFISTKETEWSSEANIRITKAKHIGLVVYNVSQSFFRGEGLYIWNGDSWEPCKSDTMSPVNGLSLINGKIGLGGNLTENTTINLQDKNLSISNVNSNFKLINLPNISDGESLVVDANGTIKSSPTIPMKLAAIQSSTSQDIGFLGDGAERIVRWSRDDIITNNGILSLDAGLESFTIQQTGYMDVSAMIAYRCRPSGSGVAVLNVNLQINNGNGWRDLSAARELYPDYKSNVVSMVVIPSAILSVKKGWKIRIKIVKPSGAGDSHVQASIIAPESSRYSKILRVVLL